MVISAVARATARIATRSKAGSRKVVRKRVVKPIARRVKEVRKGVEKSRVGKAVDSAILYPFVRQSPKHRIGKHGPDRLGVIRKDRKLSMNMIVTAQRYKMKIPGYVAGVHLDKVERFGLKHNIKVLNPEVSWEGPGKGTFLSGGAVGGISGYALYASKTSAEKKPNPKEQAQKRRRR
jgi:hypothetical protein